MRKKFELARACPNGIVELHVADYTAESVGTVVTRIPEYDGAGQIYECSDRHGVQGAQYRPHPFPHLHQLSRDFAASIVNTANRLVPVIGTP